MNFIHCENTRERISIGLLILAAVFVIVAIAKVGAFTFSPMRDPNSLAELIEQHNPDPNHVAECIADRKKVAEEIKKNNPFTPPPPKPQPPKEITGILGDSVLMQGKWYKVGDMMAGARILAIEATFVEVEWEGKKIQLAPIKKSTAPVASRPSGAGGPQRRPDAAQPSSVPPTESVQAIETERLERPRRRIMRPGRMRRVRTEGARDRDEGRRDRRRDRRR